MARTKTEADIQEFPVTDIVEKNTAEIKMAVDANDLANAIVAEKFNVIETLGVIKAANFYATISDKIIAESAINIRQGKKYKGLPYKDEDGNARHVATFEDFCSAYLNKSARRVQELMSNYNQLGPDLYEQAEKIGFRQRDYNALKALPADDRQLIAQAIEAESLDSALDLMQQLAAKHQNEKQQFTKEVADLTKSLESNNAVLKKKDEKLNELDQELERLKLDRPINAHIDWPAAFKGYVDQLAITRKNLKHSLGSLAVISAEAMKIEPASDDEEASLTQGREILATELVGIHNECLEMVQALGMQFDRTLGAYSDARIALLDQ